MGLAARIGIILTMLLFVPDVFASWQGPAEIVSSSWGSGTQQLGIEFGDGGDIFPLIEAITPDNKIIINDAVNKKQIVYGLNGIFIKEVKWIIKNQSGDWTYYDVPEYSFGPVVGYSNEGNIYTGSGNSYLLKSPTGQVIKTYTERPLELGRVTEKPVSSTKAKITVQYPDKTWSYLSVGRMPSYIRDKSGNLYGYGSTQVIRFTACGKEAASLIMPKKIEHEESRGPQIEPKVTVLEEYGSPVIAPNGDVYAWKRTPDKYSILKWTWIDDPNPTANNPDAPEKLILKAVSAGINLFWQAVPQDPGCATGYEIARSTTSGGPYSTLAKVNAGTANAAGTIRYTDTTITPGIMYYYKVRAIAGTEYSPFSNEVSGKK